MICWRKMPSTFSHGTNGECGVLKPDAERMIAGLPNAGTAASNTNAAKQNKIKPNVKATTEESAKALKKAAPLHNASKTPTNKLDDPVMLSSYPGERTCSDNSLKRLSSLTASARSAFAFRRSATLLNQMHAKTDPAMVNTPAGTPTIFAEMAANDASARAANMPAASTISPSTTLTL